MTATDASWAALLVGRDIVLAAGDYFGGTGQLALRVTQVAAGRGDPDWVVVTGRRIADDAAVEARTVAVRLSALLAFLPP